MAGADSAVGRSYVVTFVAFGIACRVIEARASGRGQVIDAGMVDGAALLVETRAETAGALAVKIDAIADQIGTTLSVPMRASNWPSWENLSPERPKRYGASS